MIRIHLLLFFILIAAALSLVTSQYKVRLLKTELEKQKQMQTKFNTEYGQLQTEQSTYAMHSKLEQYAKKRLNMAVPDIKRIQSIHLERE